ncbi:MAG TPA: hypothetical protein VKR53_16535 [Puia sp.]|nr:hypothetical protein [Puia sp.]
MKKLLLLPVIFFSLCAVKLNAQSLANTTWKGLFGDPINDTLTLHFQKDTFYVSNTPGDVVVRSVLKISKDTMTITDFDGQYMCPQAEGVYTYIISGDSIAFTLVSDACEGRNGITQIKWIRAAPKK